jgi:hypothetical protein
VRGHERCNASRHVRSCPVSAPACARIDLPGSIRQAGSHGPAAARRPRRQDVGSHDGCTGTDQRCAAWAGETHHRVFRIVNGADNDGLPGTRSGSSTCPSCGPAGREAGAQRADLPARQPGQPLHRRGSQRTLGDLLRTPDPAPFPAIRQLTPLRMPDGPAQRQHPVMPLAVWLRWRDPGRRTSIRRCAHQLRGHLQFRS